MSWRRRGTALFALTASLAACAPSAPQYPAPADATNSSLGTVPADAPSPSPYPGPTSAPEPAAFENVDWELVGSGDPVSPTTPPATVLVTARFDSTTRTVGGSAGCNSYSAPYDHAGPSMQIEEARATLMACDAPAMEVEAAYLATMARVTAWALTADELTLKTGDGIVLVYRIAEESPQ